MRNMEDRGFNAVTFLRRLLCYGARQDAQAWQAPGVFRSVADLQAAINRFVEETNSNPKLFVWTADPKRVLAAVKRGKEKLESIH